MNISLIVAVSDNGVIGRLGTLLPWHLAADMAHFKSLTMGHPIIMGRKTYETFHRPLPGRQNIIISHDAAYSAEGCEVVGSLPAALDRAEPADEVFVIGGGTLYEQALPLAAKLYLTQVHAEIEGDVFFRYDPTQWKQVSREDHQADAKNQYDYTFLTLERYSKPHA